MRSGPPGERRESVFRVKDVIGLHFLRLTPAALLLVVSCSLSTPTVGGDYRVTLAVRDQLNQVVAGTIAIKVTEAQPAPAISKAKYKPGSRKLIVSGERFDAAATLLIDGAQVVPRFDAGALIAKPVALTAGTHEVRVVNPGGVASPPYNLTVE